MFQYDSCQDGCTTTTQEIYVSSNGDELAIVIDTGASNSITPCPADFIGKIQHSRLQSLKQMNVTTPVCRGGNVLWVIEDFYGTRRSVANTSYFVPSATICLISPQIYLGTNDTAKMTLDQSGLQLTLKRGSVLHFSINLSNNLSFVLTQNLLDRGRTTEKEKGLKIRRLKVKPNNKFSLKLSTSGSGVYSSSTAIHNTLIEHSVLECSNHNLNPAQQELIK